MITVTSTKKLKPALIGAAKAEGFIISDHDFIQVFPLWSEEKQAAFDTLLAAGIQYVAVTSAHAVESLRPYIRASGRKEYNNWKMLCLSGSTKDSVAGFFHGRQHIVAEAGNARALAVKIVEQGIKDLVFFCGNLRRDDLPRTLQAAGVQVHELVVYKTAQQPLKVPAADAVLFFSPSAVESFFAVNQLEPQTVCFAIGETTGAALKGKTGNRVVISRDPTQEAVLESLYAHFKKKKTEE